MRKRHCDISHSRVALGAVAISNILRVATTLPFSGYIVAPQLICVVNAVYKSALYLKTYLGGVHYHRRESMLLNNIW